MIPPKATNNLAKRNVRRGNKAVFTQQQKKSGMQLVLLIAAYILHRWLLGQESSLMSIQIEVLKWSAPQHGWATWPTVGIAGQVNIYIYIYPFIYSAELARDPNHPRVPRVPQFGTNLPFLLVGSCFTSLITVGSDGFLFSNRTWPWQVEQHCHVSPKVLYPSRSSIAKSPFIYIYIIRLDGTFLWFAV